MSFHEGLELRNVMKDRPPSVIGNGCPMCQDLVGSMAWLRLINKGIKSAHDMAEHYHVDVQEVVNHVNTHMTYRDESGRERSIDSMTDRLYKLLSSFDDWWDQLLAECGGKAPDRFTMQTASTISKEIRETVKLMAEFEGRVGNNAMHQVIEIKAEYTQLIGLIMEHGDDHCKTKVLEYIDAHPKLLADGKP